jgi:hypothetical protein
MFIPHYKLQSLLFELVGLKSYFIQSQHVQCCSGPSTRARTIFHDIGDGDAHVQHDDNGEEDALIQHDNGEEDALVQEDSGRYNN